MSFIEENFWTCILTPLVALLFMLILPSPLQYFISNFNFNNISQSPSETITGYVVGFSMATIEEGFMKIISFLLGGIIGAIIGLFIDGKINSRRIY